MAKYPGTENERKFPPAALHAAVAGIFGKCGMTAEDADRLADNLVMADLRGVHSHGVMRVPDYVRKLGGGGVDPRGRPRVLRDEGGALLIDGANSMGAIGGTFAMTRAIERARTANVAVAALRGSNHCGAMDYYARMAAAEDMIGLATTNAMPTMAPWGGVDKLVGLNPVSIAVPTLREPVFVIDTALGATAHGKMQIYKQKGEPIPEGWAFDAEGRPTTDIDEALSGLIQPIGGYKGIGLAMCMGILAGLLPGAAYGRELGNLVDGPVAGADGQFFLALRVAAFEEPSRFKTRVDGIIREVYQSRRAAGVARLYAPGALDAEIEARNRAAGIPLNDETIKGMTTAAERLGADVTMLRPLA